MNPDSHYYTIELCYGRKIMHYINIYMHLLGSHRLLIPTILTYLYIFINVI